jgi:hypothetical protein
MMSLKHFSHFFTFSPLFIQHPQRRLCNLETHRNQDDVRTHHPILRQIVDHADNGQHHKDDVEAVANLVLGCH